MNTVYKIAILLTGAMLYGCTQAKTEPSPEPSPKPQPEPAVSLTLTFVLPDAPEGEEAASIVKESWVPGDKIVVHGEYAKEQVEVTLSASDINGKSATVTVDGLHPYKSSERTCTLYASYPASAVSNPAHCYCYSGFTDANTPVMAAYNEGNTFNFVNVSSAISFKVSGEFDTYTLSARKGATLSYGYYQVKLTDTEVNLKQYVKNPVTGFNSDVVYDDGQTPNCIYIAGGINLPDGLVMNFYKDGAIVKKYSNKSLSAASPGSILDLGDITPYLKDNMDNAVALDRVAPANCYIITEPGLYKFPAIKGNDKTQILDGVESVVTLWETWNTAWPAKPEVPEGEEAPEEEPAITPGSIVESLEYDDDEGVVFISIPQTLHSGNALVAAKDNSGKVLWSWHIWVPETDIQLIDAGFAADAPIMDRNLGALVPATTDVVDLASYGLYYQWGRKDPLCGTHISGYPASAFKQYVAGQAQDFESSIANPTVFYYVESSNWFVGEAITNLWDDAGSKSKYDPCPPGYRVPAFDKTRGLWKKSGASLTFNQEKGYFTLAPGTSVFTLGGYLNGTGQSESGYGARGYVLSATHVSTTNAGCALIRDNAYSYDSYYKSCGGNIRCTIDE